MDNSAKFGKRDFVSGLFLSGTQWTDQLIQNLLPLRSLEDLGLRGAKVTSAGLAHLSGFPNLEKIRLYLTSVDDDGMIDLGRMSKLRLVDVASTQITDAGLGHLMELPNLEQLDVSSTTVSKETVVQFKLAHPKCTVDAYAIGRSKPH